MTDRIHLPPPLRRVGELELERSRRSGRSFSLLLVQFRPVGRTRRSRRAAGQRLRSVAQQHLRPFDHVETLPADSSLAVVLHDASADAAERVARRLIDAAEATGSTVVGAATSTFPQDGLLLSHLVDRAVERACGPDTLFADPADAPDARVGAANAEVGR